MKHIKPYLILSLLFSIIFSNVAYSGNNGHGDACIGGAWTYKQYVSFFQPNPKALSQTQPELVNVNYGTFIVTSDGLWSGFATDYLTNPIKPAVSTIPIRGTIGSGFMKRVRSGEYLHTDISYIAIIDQTSPYLAILPEGQLVIESKATVTMLNKRCTRAFYDGIANVYPPDTVDFRNTTPLNTFYLQSDAFKAE